MSNDGSEPVKIPGVNMDDWSLAGMARQIHATAREKGWWPSRREEQRTFGDLIALCHSELSEALEAFRDTSVSNPRVLYYGPDGKPEGVPSELADVIIRVLDMCEWYHIDIEDAVRTKMEYNTRRAYRHGGKRI